MNLSGSFRAFQAYARNDGRGVGVSILLHALIVLLILLLAKRVLPEQPAYEGFVPVSLVAQSEGPEQKPQQQKAAGSVSKTPQILPRARIAVHTSTGVAPRKTTLPSDDLEVQLKALSKLKQPNADPRLLGDAGNADVAESGNDNASGGNGDYNSRDIIRAQVLRRWSLDMGRLGNRSFVVSIHVLLKRDGTVLEADIVDKQRYTNDAAYRWIALSARNAVILSSPLALPSGVSDENLDMILKLNPRDTLQ